MDAGLALTDMMDTYPTFALVTYRLGDQYELPWGRARTAMYGGCADGYPWFAIDALEDGWPVADYEPKYLARQVIPTDVTIAVTTGGGPDSDTHDIQAEVCVDPVGTATSMRVYMVQVLDNYPDSPDYARNCFMQAAATEDVLVSPGECAYVDRTFTFDALNMSRQNDIKIIVWAQVPGDLWPLEVYQATEAVWPFTLREDIFSDGFESGFTTNWSVTFP